MTPRIRLLRSLYDAMLADLQRPHVFAFERVGFLYGRLANAHADPLVLMTGYVSLADDRYVDDPRVGARIDSQAMIDRRFEHPEVRTTRRTVKRLASEVQMRHDHRRHFRDAQTDRVPQKERKPVEFGRFGVDDLAMLVIGLYVQ